MCYIRTNLWLSWTFINTKVVSSRMKVVYCDSSFLFWNPSSSAVFELHLLSFFSCFNKQLPISIMGFKVSQMWKKPETNPLNGKARSIPVLNIIDTHGRVFFFSWLGFLIAFWSWLVIYSVVYYVRTLTNRLNRYAFPPLVRLEIG